MSYITIYFGDKPVFLCNEITPQIEEYQRRADTIFSKDPSAEYIQSLADTIGASYSNAAILFNPDFEKLKKDFFSHFKLVKAAGGLVKNQKGQILMIFRRGKWDLPKGKLEDHEAIEECAKREVQEETGIHDLEVGDPLGITYHTYHLPDNFILKECHWFAMKTRGDEKLIPQTEEDISKSIWANADNMKEYISNSFPTIVKVLENA
jgi:8-oxo-dGTP pyrophosphatase MutT (NUDIX family)